MTLDPSSWPGGGGGGGVSTQRQAFGGGSNVSVADAGLGRLPLGTSFGPNTLIDKSTPDLPVVLASGVYFVLVIFSTAGGTLTNGGSYRARLELDPNDVDAAAYGDSPLSGAGYTVSHPWLTLGLTCYIPAGEGFIASVYNLDGASARDFAIVSAFVQLIG